MLYSMTGFGKGVVHEGEFSVEAEIKSFNNRFLDLSIRIPKSISDKEFAIREILRKNIKRGKISLSVFMKKEGSDSRQIFIDEHGLKATVSLLNELTEKSGFDSKLEIDHLLQFQNLFLTDSIFDPEKEFELTGKAIIKAIEELKQMRKSEGAELEKDLVNRVILIENYVDEIEKISPQSVSSYFEKLKQRAKQLFTDLEDNPERLQMELALIAEKYDTTEECVRLKSHIKMFKETLKLGDEVGRKLNFITQEMNREANTINSKSVSSDISAKGIYIKEELEKIREQIQNIE